MNCRGFAGMLGFRLRFIVSITLFLSGVVWAGSAAAQSVTDDFNSYSDGQYLAFGLGIPANDWIESDHFALEKTTVTISAGDAGTYEVVQDPTMGSTYNTSFNQVSTFDTNNHSHAKVQVDVIWTSTGNAQVGGVVLHNPGTQVGMYGGDNHYRMRVDTKYGGRWDLTWPGGGSGPRLPGFNLNEWYTLILEADHDTAGQVTLDATVKDTSSGNTIDTYMKVATGAEILTGGNAGMQIQDNIAGVSPHIFLDNFEMAYTGVGPFAGDVNADGFVGGADMTRIIGNYGIGGAAREHGDLSGDGIVGNADYGEVEFTWGSGVPPSPPPAAPPPGPASEPESASLSSPGKTTDGGIETATVGGAGLIVSNGQAYVTIAYADTNALPVATRLQDFVTRMTDVVLPIDHISGIPPGSPRILVGPQAAQIVGIVIPQTYPGGERVVVESVGDDIVIAGNDAAGYTGTRYALDRFLLEFGCELFGPDPNWHVIPQHSELVITNVAIDATPDFESRSPFFWQYPHTGSHPDFDAPSWGNGGTPFHITHNFYQMFPPEQFFDDHPDWFAEVGGVRVPWGQINFAHPDVQARAIQLAREHFDNDPTQVMFSLSANDALGFCEDAGCQALGANISAQNLAFANIVATNLQLTHPDKHVAFIAYLGTHPPPIGVTAVPGVEVFLVNHTDRIHSLDESSCQIVGNKAEWKQMLQGWKAAGVDLSGVYEYYLPSAGGWHNVLWVPGDGALRDLRYYHTNDVRYLYFEGVWAEVLEDTPIRWPLSYVA